MQLNSKIVQMRVRKFILARFFFDRKGKNKSILKKTLEG